MSKDRIIQSALSRFTTQGYDGTALSEIAADVGIRKPSIYSHFSSKQNIFETLLAEAFLREKTLLDELRDSTLPVKESLHKYLYDIPVRYEDNLYLKFWLQTLYLPPASMVGDIKVYDIRYSECVDLLIKNKIFRFRNETELIFSPDLVMHSFTGIIRGIHAELLYKGLASAIIKIDALWKLFELVFK